MPKNVNFLEWPAWVPPEEYASRPHKGPIRSAFEESFTLGEIVASVTQKNEAARETPGYEFREALVLLGAAIDSPDTVYPKAMIGYDKDVSKAKFVGIQVLDKLGRQAPSHDVSHGLSEKLPQELLTLRKERTKDAGGAGINKDEDSSVEAMQPGPVYAVQFYIGGNSPKSAQAMFTKTKPEVTISQYRANHLQSIHLLHRYLEQARLSLSVECAAEMRKLYGRPEDGWEYAYIGVPKPPQLEKEEPVLVACRVCAVPTHIMCQRCLGVHYCGRDHQRADWSRHKKECVQSKVEESVSGTSGAEEAGKSTKIHLVRDNDPSLPYQLTYGSHGVKSVDQSKMPENIHPGKFIVKIQVPLDPSGRFVNGPTTRCMIYDQRRSFLSTPLTSRLPDVVKMIIDHQGLHGGPKAYFYAQREGEHIRVFHDALAPRQPW